MRKLLLLIFMNASFLGYAQDTSSTAKKDTVKPDPNWKIESIAKIQANQAQFRNWQSGGINSVSWTAFMDLSADYNKNGWSWTNDLQLGYGQQFQDETDWRKTDDIINYVTQVGRSLDTNDVWSLIANASFRSQFTDGFDYPVDSIRTSNWLAPGYINAGLGFQYQPKKYVQFIFTPVSTKITIVNDQRLADLGTYGNEAAVLDTAGNVVTPGKKVRAEFGGTIGIKFEKEIVKNINYKSNLGLFSNYLENPQNIDLVWNNLITFKVNDIINFTFTLDMIYDDDIDITEYNSDGSIKGVGPRLQLKQMFGFGLNYTIRNFTPKE